MTDNMELWNKVFETDPAYTKPVTFGRKFTAIDPMYQIRSATEQFGVAGKGWGWKVNQVQFLPNDTVAVLVELWAGSPDNFVQQWGQCGLYTNNDKSIDDKDCMKKATTDGITKCLSYLGFNADVFMGRFDDNKYVEEMRAKKSITPVDKTGNREIDQDLMQKAKAGIEMCTTIESATNIGRAAWKELKAKGATKEQLGVIQDHTENKIEYLKAKGVAA